MNALRRAVGRKEFVLALLLFLPAGGWFGWQLLAQYAQIQPLSGAEQFEQALADANAAGLASDDWRDRALAQTFSGDVVAARQTTEALSGSVQEGPDLAVVDGLKALALMGPDGLYTPEAKAAAQRSLQNAGQDPLAILLSSVAYAASLRVELDQPMRTVEARAHLGDIRRTLQAVCNQPEPPSAWHRYLWRRSLALLVDSHILAAEAGESTAEDDALVLLRQFCPSDIWTSHFAIPDKALASLRANSLDDQSRLAMYTAAGYLYTQAGDRIHCDALFQRAMRIYGRLLEDYDGWDGERVPTTTPKGRIKEVGVEFYSYRDRIKKLVRYSADWWGIRVLEGSVDLATALQVCDEPLFRAIVRLRVDRQTDPIVILQQEQTPAFDYFIAGQWFEVNPYLPQAEWEKQRGKLIQQVGQEESLAIDSIARARKLMREKHHDESLALLAKALQAEPALAETRVSLLCEVAAVLMNEQSYAEALRTLDTAEEVLKVGDSRLSQTGVSFLRGRIAYYRMYCALGSDNKTLAVQSAEQIVGDAAMPLSVRARTLLHLVEFYTEMADGARAQDAYQRLLNLPVSAEQSQALLEPLVDVARSRLSGKD